MDEIAECLEERFIFWFQLANDFIDFWFQGHERDTEGFGKGLEQITDLLFAPAWDSPLELAGREMLHESDGNLGGETIVHFAGSVGIAERNITAGDLNFFRECGGIELQFTVAHEIFFRGEQILVAIFFEKTVQVGDGGDIGNSF